MSELSTIRLPNSQLILRTEPLIVFPMITSCPPPLYIPGFDNSEGFPDETSESRKKKAKLERSRKYREAAKLQRKIEESLGTRRDGSARVQRCDFLGCPNSASRKSYDSVRCIKHSGQEYHPIPFYFCDKPKCRQMLASFPGLCKKHTKKRPLLD